MKTKFLMAAVILATNCTIANAQVLGGNAAGSFGGALGVGGVRDIGAVGHGTANGAFDADLHTESLRRRTNEVASRASTRTRATLDKSRSRVRETTDTVGRAGNRAVAATHDQAIHGAMMASSAAAAGKRSAIAASQHSAATVGNATPSLDVDSQLDSQATSMAELDATKQEGELPAIPNAASSAAFEPASHARLAQPERTVDISGDASAGGNASASTQGAHASGSASGAGEVSLGN